MRGNGMKQLANESMTFESTSRHISLKVSDDSPTGLLNFFDSNENEFGRIIARGLDGQGSGNLTFENVNNVGFGVSKPDTKVHNAGAYTQESLTSDPADPDPGHVVKWMSGGSGSGSDGDLMAKITDSSGTTKLVTIVSFANA
jgi:hypothetical protein